MIDRKKGDPEGSGGRVEVGEMGGGDCDQDVLCEKKNLF